MMTIKNDLHREDWIKFWDYIVPLLAHYTIKRSIQEEFAPLLFFTLLLGFHVHYGMALGAALIQFGIPMLVQLVFAITIWFILKFIQKRKRGNKYLIACLYNTDAGVKTLYTTMTIYSLGIFLMTQEMPGSLPLQIISVILLTLSGLLGWFLAPYVTKYRLRKKPDTDGSLATSKKMLALVVPIACALIALIYFIPNKTTLMVLFANLLGFVLITLYFLSFRNLINLLCSGIPKEPAE